MSAQYLFILFVLFECIVCILSQSNSCPNCLHGCDDSLSCFNNTCKPNYFGNSCANKIFEISNIIFSYTSNPCSIIIQISEKVVIPSGNSFNYTMKYIEGDFSNQPVDKFTHSDTSNSPTIQFTINSLKPNTGYTFAVFFYFSVADLSSDYISKIHYTYASCNNITLTTTTTTTTTTVSHPSTSYISTTRTSSVSSAATTLSTKATNNGVSVPTITTTSATKPPYKLPSPVFNQPKQTTYINISFPDVSGVPFRISWYLIAIIKEAETKSATRKKRTVSCAASFSINDIPFNAEYRLNSSVLPNEPLILGNGSSLRPSKCTNTALSPNTTYIIYAAVVSSSPPNTNPQVLVSFTNAFTNAQTDLDFLTWFVPFIVVLILILLIILIVLLICFLQRRKKHEPAQPYLFPTKTPDTYLPKSADYWSSINDRMEARKLNLDNPQRLSGLDFKNEYENLPHDRQCISTIWSKIEIKIMGRNHEIELDTGYIPLHRDDNILTSGKMDQYNASLIDSYVSKRGYIATNHPIEDNSSNLSRLADFWWLVYQENVGQIVMLDNGDSRFPNLSNYWPDKQNFKSADLEVNLISEDIYANCVIRQMHMRCLRNIKSQSSILITQYQYTGVIAYDDLPGDLVEFVGFCDMVKANTRKIYGPLLVHSVNESLSMVFMAYHNLHEQHLTENMVNVFKQVANMLRGRIRLNLNMRQYLYLYDMLFESYVARDYSYCNMTSATSARSPRKGRSQLATFNNLQQSTFNYDYSELWKIICRYSLQFDFNGTYALSSFRFNSAYRANAFIVKSVSDPLMIWQNCLDNDVNLIIDLRYSSIDEALRHLEVNNPQLRAEQSSITINHANGAINACTIQVKYGYVRNMQVELAHCNVLFATRNYSGDYAHGESRTQLVKYISENYTMSNIMLLGDIESTNAFIAVYNCAEKFIRQDFANPFYIMHQIKSRNHEAFANEMQIQSILQTINEILGYYQQNNHKINRNTMRKFRQSLGSADLNEKYLTELNQMEKAEVAVISPKYQY